MADSERFNPNHVPGGAGGGQFTSGSGGSGGKAPAAKGKAPAKAPAAKAAHAKGHAHPALPDTPNGLGYSAAQWRQLQQWEADYKAGKKLDHHQLHMLHEAHLKHVAALGRKIAVAGAGAHHHLQAQREAHKAHAARLAREAALAKARGRSGEPDGDDAERASDLEAGQGSALWRYWTKGEGLAKWSGAVHKWTTLRDLLLAAGVPAHSADGLATNIIMAVMPGYMTLAHEGKGRSAMAASSKPYGDVEYADPENGKYPIDTAKHAKAAWDYISQPGNAGQYAPGQLAEVKKRIMAACQKFGIDTDGDMNSADPAGEERGGGLLTRAVPFEVIRAAGGRSDGLTLEGYAAVFNRTARIRDSLGDFDEQIIPGAFSDSLARKTPVLMFEHGKHPLIGSMPLGRINDIHEDQRGLFISARLSDNWLIQPVRDAVRDGAVTGMSFRFASPGKDDQRWEKRDGQPDLRSLLRLDPPELGPVVFPAYEPTTAAVRSLLDELGEDFTGRVTARSGPGREHDVRPGNGAASPTTQTALRDRAWRMRRQLDA